MNAPVRGKLMYSEIHEQPEAVARLIGAERAHIQQFVEKWGGNAPKGILIAARGTSDHAALYAKYVFETMNGIPVGLMAPSVAGIYNAKVNVKDYLVIGISQSGEAADVIAAIEQSNEGGATTLAITNVDGSPLAKAAQDTILLNAKPEIAVAATKTYTTTMASLLMLSAAMAKSSELDAMLDRIPSLIDDVFANEKAYDSIFEKFHYLQECVILGRGYNMSSAYELALKLRETCYIRSQPFASPDFVHGPIAILDEGFPVIAFANNGPTLPSVMEVVKKVQSRGADVVVIGNAKEALDIADIAFPVNTKLDVPEIISTYPAITVGQLLAHATSVSKGIDPDNPRSLNKVTITK